MVYPTEETPPPACYTSFTLHPFPRDPLDLAPDTDQLSEGHNS